MNATYEMLSECFDAVWRWVADGGQMDVEGAPAGDYARIALDNINSVLFAIREKGATPAAQAVQQLQSAVDTLTSAGVASLDSMCALLEASKALKENMEQNR